MPTDTFNKLSQEKKEKIIVAAKKEFSRANIRDASIKNIVEEAGIARGSFYQYFESKEDLLQFLLKEHIKKMNETIEGTIEKTNGDIFEIYIAIYDYMVNKCINQEKTGFFKKVIEEIKTSQDSVFAVDIKKYQPKNMDEYYTNIDKTNLKINSIEEFRILNTMLYAITKKAIVCSFKYNSKNKAKKDYLKQLEYIKYGVLRDNSKELQESKKGGENV